MEDKRTQGKWVYDKIKTSIGHCLRVGTKDQFENHDNTGKPSVPSYACIYVDYNKGEKEAEANAQFIVKAVNNHEKLVEALRGIYINSDSLGVEGICEIALQALNNLEVQNDRS